jgi:hypothetical protein
MASYRQDKKMKPREPIKPTTTGFSVAGFRRAWPEIDRGLTRLSETVDRVLDRHMPKRQAQGQSKAGAA